MSQIAEISPKPEQKLDQLKAILFLLQTNLEEFKDQVDRSYALLEIGEMTELTKKIENSLANPVDSIFEASSNIESQVKHIIDLFVKNFLRQHVDLVASAFRTKTPCNDLHYCIALKEDNIDARSKMFQFFNKYDLFEISNQYPVYFQFIPFDLMDKIKASEYLKLS